MEDKFSAFSTLCFLFVSCPVFCISILYMLASNNKYWFVTILLCSALLSLLMSSVIIHLTEIVHAEEDGSGPEVRLLPAEEQEQQRELSLPILVYLARPPYRNMLYTISLYCCLLILMKFSLVIVNIIALNIKIAFESNEAAHTNDVSVNLVLAAILCIIISVLNYFDMHSTRWVPIVGALFKGLAVICFLVETQDFRFGLSIFEMVQFGFFGFLHQIQLPCFAVYRVRPEVASWCQRLSVLLLLVCYCLPYTADTQMIKPEEIEMCTLTHNPQTENDILMNAYGLKFMMAAYIIQTTLIWKVFSRILTAWRYDTTLEVARDNYPIKTKLIECFCHWPIVIICLVIQLTRDMKDIRKDIDVFTLLAILALFFILQCSYESKLNNLIGRNIIVERRIPNYMIVVVKFLIIVLVFLYAWILIEFKCLQSDFFSKIWFNPAFSGGLIVIMIAWRRLGNLI